MVPACLIHLSSVTGQAQRCAAEVGGGQLVTGPPCCQLKVYGEAWRRCVRYMGGGLAQVCTVHGWGLRSGVYGTWVGAWLRCVRYMGGGLAQVCTVHGWGLGSGVYGTWGGLAQVCTVHGWGGAWRRCVRYMGGGGGAWRRCVRYMGGGGLAQVCTVHGVGAWLRCVRHMGWGLGSGVYGTWVRLDTGVVHLANSTGSAVPNTGQNAPT